MPIIPKYFVQILSVFFETSYDLKIPSCSQINERLHTSQILNTLLYGHISFFAQLYVVSNCIDYVMA